ncbi:hypothetical protein ElyMa_005577800 [Elysia marginata]|uniref:Uncharacterized protein n=1 Tax=Elysia marginata TaxID=1093978 RepID=A0AAV4F2L1_9GAST|nr:hypothetical protein ElyMa_005577800 [Elysia marginata]
MPFDVWIRNENKRKIMRGRGEKIGPEKREEIKKMFTLIINSFYALPARSGGQSPLRRKFKMADWLAGPVSQSSALKPTLHMGVITSYFIVVGAQGLQCLTQRSRISKRCHCSSHRNLLVCLP